MTIVWLSEARWFWSLRHGPPLCCFSLSQELRTTQLAGWGLRLLSQLNESLTPPHVISVHWGVGRESFERVGAQCIMVHYKRALISFCGSTSNFGWYLLICTTVSLECGLFRVWEQLFFFFNVNCELTNVGANCGSPLCGWGHSTARLGNLAGCIVNVRRSQRSCPVSLWG